MKDRILEHIKERNGINYSLEKIMGHSNHSPFNILFLEMDWSVSGDSLHIQVDDEDLEENFYEYQISSLGALGVELFMGEKDGYTYVMAHDGDWENTEIIILDNKHKK
jgi:hypothetical protein